MKCIKLTIDEDSFVCNVEDGLDKFNEDNFNPVGNLYIGDKDEVYTQFTIDETESIEFDNNPSQWHAYILIEDEDFVDRLSNDGVFFSGSYVEFTV